MREEISFLEIVEVVQIHENQIELYGGVHEIRDENLLESAVNMPKSMFKGESPLFINLSLNKFQSKTKHKLFFLKN
jgi:prophage maintenance system killer protein